MLTVWLAPPLALVGAYCLWRAAGMLRDWTPVTAHLVDHDYAAGDRHEDALRLAFGRVHEDCDRSREVQTVYRWTDAAGAEQSAHVTRSVRLGGRPPGVATIWVKTDDTALAKAHGPGPWALGTLFAWGYAGAALLGVDLGVLTPIVGTNG